MRANACFFSFCALLLVLCVSGWCAAFQPPDFCLEQGGQVMILLNRTDLSNFNQILSDYGLTMAAMIRICRLP